jgi:hypothetical protein
VAVLHGVHRPLDVVDRRPDHDPPGQALLVTAVEGGEPVEEQVDPDRRARLPDGLGPPYGARPEDGRVEETRGALRVRGRHHRGGVDLGPVSEGDTRGAPVAGADRHHVGVRADLDAA